MYLVIANFKASKELKTIGQKLSDSEAESYGPEVLLDLEKHGCIKWIADEEDQKVYDPVDQAPAPEAEAPAPAPKKKSKKKES